MARSSLGPWDLSTIERHESSVRSYVRRYPVVLTRARGARIETADGRSLLDFFAGAGALNYGHAEPRMKAALLEYIAADGITHALDFATAPKLAFIERFVEVVLAPRRLDYRLLFPGPTGANAIEAALKLVRRATGRSTVVTFTNAYHGATIGTLALTGSRADRRSAGLPLSGAVPLPYDGYLGPDVDTITLLERMLADPASGLDLPAAVFVETVQAEGGVQVARPEWLARLARVTRAHGALLVVDDIQVGCGRTGSFFSFEQAGVVPDVVALSKSISGFGLPMSLVLARPDVDVLRPGEHTGTFRGNALAFVTATAALSYWADGALAAHVQALHARAQEQLLRLVQELGLPSRCVRGRGLILGVELGAGVAEAVASRAFELGVLVETVGAQREVLKLLPPLTITRDELDEGLSLLGRAARERFVPAGAA